MKTGTIARIVIGGRGGAPYCMAVHCKVAALRNVPRQRFSKEPEEERVTLFVRGAWLQVVPKLIRDSNNVVSSHFLTRRSLQ